MYPVFLLLLFPIQLDARPDDQKNEQTEEQKQSHRKILLDWNADVLQGKFSDANEIVVRTFAGCPSENDLADGAVDGGPDGEIESPEIVLQSRRVFHAEDEDVPDDDGRVDVQKPLHQQKVPEN